MYNNSLNDNVKRISEFEKVICLESYNVTFTYAVQPIALIFTTIIACDNHDMWGWFIADNLLKSLLH